MNSNDIAWPSPMEKNFHKIRLYFASYEVTMVLEIVKDDWNINSHFHYLFSFEDVLSKNTKLNYKPDYLSSFKLFRTSLTSMSSPLYESME